jgi:hypothetical protein
MPAVDAGIIVFLTLAICILGGLLMSQLDDLKVALADTQAAQTQIAAALTEIASDLDDLIALVSAGSPDLTEVLAAATAIRDAAKSQADAATADAAKFTPPEV